VKAVDGITFNIAAGELVGYLGPNGAGKSTTIKMLTGLLVPSSGKIQVAGRIPWQERIQHVRKIGAVFGQRTTLWWDLPVIESLELLQHMYRVPIRQYERRLDEYRSLLDLDTFINIPVRALSLGQRMRADICAALLHDPDILFLDEPTIGLDVVAKEKIRQFILHINQVRGTTVLLTTHDLRDIEKLCERVMIIDQGKLLFDGQLDTLQHRFGGKRELVVEFAEEYTDIAVDGAAISHRAGRVVHFQFNRASITASELIGRISASYRIQDLSVREPDVETTIRHIYEKQLLNQPDNPA
jgi:ABC-2 type transport system ATP-binding protein